VLRGYFMEIMRLEQKPTTKTIIIQFVKCFSSKKGKNIGVSEDPKINVFETLIKL